MSAMGRLRVLTGPSVSPATGRLRMSRSPEDECVLHASRLWTQRLSVQRCVHSSRACL